MGFQHGGHLTTDLYGSVPVLFEDLYFTTSAISITPSLGAETLLNNTFAAWTGDNPNDWITTETPPNSEITEAAGGGRLHMISDSTLVRVYQEPNVLTNFYAYSFVVDSAAGLAYLGAGATILRTYGSTGTFVGTYRATTGISYALYTIGTPGCDFIFSAASNKLISNMASFYPHPQWWGDFTINYSRTAFYQAGVYASYVDANNWLLLMDGGDAKAYLYKNIAGTQTEIGSWAMTYAADKDLTLRVHKDGTLDVIYNGSTLASGQADTGLRGKNGGVLLTNATEVTVNSYTWDARSST